MYTLGVFCCNVWYKGSPRERQRGILHIFVVVHCCFVHKKILQMPAVTRQIYAELFILYFYTWLFLPKICLNKFRENSRFSTQFFLRRVAAKKKVPHRDKTPHQILYQTCCLPLPTSGKVGSEWSGHFKANKEPFLGQLREQGIEMSENQAITSQEVKNPFQHELWQFY